MKIECWTILSENTIRSLYAVLSTSKYLPLCQSMLLDGLERVNDQNPCERLKNWEDTCPFSDEGILLEKIHYLLSVTSSGNSLEQYWSRDFTPPKELPYSATYHVQKLFS